MFEDVVAVTHHKKNGWNLKISPTSSKENHLNQTFTLGSILIFSGVNIDGMMHFIYTLY